MPIPVDIADVLCKLGLATLLGGALGLERERKRRAAGLRTHIIVCLASTLAMILSTELSNEWMARGSSAPMDRGRVIAGILQGIGFLGAGAIIQTGSVHRGLTTAAMIWFSAALGVAIGLGYYSIAVCACAFALAAALLLEPMGNWLSGSYELALELVLPGGHERAAAVESLIKQHGCTVSARRIVVRKRGNCAELRFSINAKHRISFEKLVETLNQEFPDLLQLSMDQ